MFSQNKLVGLKIYFKMESTKTLTLISLFFLLTIFLGSLVSANIEKYSANNINEVYYTGDRLVITADFGSEIIIDFENIGDGKPYDFYFDGDEGFFEGEITYTSPSGGALGSPYHKFIIQGTFTTYENNLVRQGAIYGLIEANTKSGSFYSNYNKEELNVKFIENSQTDSSSFENRIDDIEYELFQTVSGGTFYDEY